MSHEKRISYKSYENLLRLARQKLLERQLYTSWDKLIADREK
jgi:hypothetical protein